MRKRAWAAVAVALWAGAAQAQSLMPGDKYVAMGSSYAAGPGITRSADDPPDRCARSRDNYAHQIAREHGLALADVSCSGAITAALLGEWKGLKPELDAVDASTRLVTVTIGGNDVGYVGGLNAQACQTLAQPGATCGAVPSAPADADWADLEARLTQVAKVVHERAPKAKLVFVDYPTILPPSGTCARLSLTATQAEVSRALNRRVVEITAKVARATGSELVAASALTLGHDACSAMPWANGYPRPGAPVDGAPFHPRLEAHTAIAHALDQLLWR